MHLMEDVHLVENRGSGIDAMLEAMQKRGLPAPVFEDKKTAFQVKFYQVKPAELSEEEQRIIAYVKEHGSIRRSEAQKLLEVSDRRARYVLETMVKARFLRQEGRQKGARYLLL
jgi:predicted HTH transcriptional regulator